MPYKICEDKRNIPKLRQKTCEFPHESKCKHMYSNDLYTIGKWWIDGLRKFLTGRTVQLMPTVKAATEEPPKKPCPMRYKDLPLYTSPHHDYQKYIEDRERCKEYKSKMLHSQLLPYVSHFRKQAFATLCEFKCSSQRTVSCYRHQFSETKSEFKAYMRHPDNLTLRQGVLTIGVATGFLAGGGGGLTRRLISTSLGALAAGALVFPEETDQAVRNVAYYSSQVLLAAYKTTCGKCWTLNEKMPCKENDGEVAVRNSQCENK